MLRVDFCKYLEIPSLVDRSGSTNDTNIPIEKEWDKVMRKRVDAITSNHPCIRSYIPLKYVIIMQRYSESGDRISAEFYYSE